jgi:hypothetical protein
LLNSRKGLKKQPDSAYLSEMIKASWPYLEMLTHRKVEKILKGLKQHKSFFHKLVFRQFLESCALAQGNPEHLNASLIKLNARLKLWDLYEEFCERHAVTKSTATDPFTGNAINTPVYVKSEEGHVYCDLETVLCLKGNLATQHSIRLEHIYIPQEFQNEFELLVQEKRQLRTVSIPKSISLGFFQAPDIQQNENENAPRMTPSL